MNDDLYFKDFKDMSDIFFCITENKILKERIDKAIEYIENHRKVYKLGVNQETDEFDYISTSPQVLLNILRGKDNE